MGYKWDSARHVARLLVIVLNPLEWWRWYLRELKEFAGYE